MIPVEIIKKVKLIEIKTKHIVDNLFGGEYNSAFKGTGMEFSEVREYQTGDDVRSIDWNVTARSGKPFIKKFDEERELSVILVIDLSSSCFYGTGSSLKSDTIIELSSILSFSAIKNNDKVGLLMFSDEIEKFIPPQKGKKHVLRVIREIIYHKSSFRNTNISNALMHLNKYLKRKSIIFLISDFWDYNFYNEMKIINKKHDLINIQILDDSEINIPNIGMVKFHDVEKNNFSWIDTSKNNYRESINANVTELLNKFNHFCKKNNIDTISLKSNNDYIKALENFFNNRIHRKH